MNTHNIQSTLVISNLTGPDKKFELSVVRDNQSVTSRMSRYAHSWPLGAWEAHVLLF